MSAPLLPKRAAGVEQTANNHKNSHTSYKSILETNELIEMGREASTQVANNNNKHHKSSSFNNSPVDYTAEHEATGNNEENSTDNTKSSTKYDSNPKYDHIRFMKSSTKLSLRSSGGGVYGGRFGNEESDNYDVTRGLFRFSLGKPKSICAIPSCLVLCVSSVYS